MLPVFPPPLFFLIIGFWQRGWGEEKDFYQPLFTGQWIFFTIWMYLWNAWVIHYSRFWSMTMGLRNDWCYLFPDFISLILFIPWPCVPRLIRNQGFSLISWWVSCSALSQICCFHYLSYSWWLLLKLSFFLPLPLHQPLLFFFLLFFLKHCFVTTGLGLFKIQALKRERD